jgi:hypothetical protein
MDRDGSVSAEVSIAGTELERFAARGFVEAELPAPLIEMRFREVRHGAL